VFSQNEFEIQRLNSEFETLSSVQQFITLYPDLTEAAGMWCLSMARSSVLENVSSKADDLNQGGFLPSILNISWLFYSNKLFQDF